MSSPDDQPTRQEQSDQAWSDFVRTPQGGCFTIAIGLMILGSIVYVLFFA